MVGKTIHQYQILDQLGAGGMGEIYKAQDSRLNRFVAIKVLTNASAGDPERRRRFIQEAQAASALNHPNIITIHDIVSEEGLECMVMEFVQGKILVDLIPKGGLRVPQVLKCALQMTDALRVAHAAGIIHRDLKPGNIMMTESGLVKILDFGLAKLTSNEPLSQVSQSDATRTIAEAPLTVEGSIVGTVSYMSPEQAQGKKVDGRSDIFSLGVVLYEMVTGTRAFSGDSALSTLSSILRDDAKPILEIAPDVPPQLEHVITRCLRKNPDDRFQSMQEVLSALNALKHESDSGVLYRSRTMTLPQAPRRAVGPSPALLIGVGALAAVLAVGGALWWVKHRATQQANATAQVQAVQSPAVAPPVAPVVAPPTNPAPPADATTSTANAAAPVTPSPAATPPPTPVTTPKPADQPLNNDAIILMAQAKVSQNVIMSQIRTAKKTDFSLSPTEIVRLSKSGVSPEVIETMRNPKQTAASVAPPAAAPSSPPPTPSSAPPPPAPTPAPAPTTTSYASITVPDGLPIAIALSQDISNTADAGQPVKFSVSKPIELGGFVVIAKGASVTGEIVSGAKKKLFGGAKMTFRLSSVEGADGKNHPVRAVPSAGKNERPVETQAKPKSKDLAAEAGAAYIAYIDGETVITVRK